MKVTILKPTEYYSCSVCRNDFVWNCEITIIRGISPICSTRCIFKLYFHTLKNYKRKNLVYLAKQLNIEKINGVSIYNPLVDINSLVFEITKKYPKVSLSSINTIKNLGTKGQGTNFRDKIGKLGTKGQQIPPYVNRGVVPVPVPLFPQKSQTQLVPKSQEGLSKWF